ncbi:MAG TPA: hypothetical protein DCZ75_17510 [Geobacter sp.]|nr:hypothetical protein [Geobacter sp.]
MKKDDSKLGAAIVDGLVSGTAAGECPTLEEIARLVDGSLACAERDAVLGHLAHCDDCRETFLTTAELAGTDAASGQPAARTRRRYLVSSALAAAAVLVVALSLQFSDSPTEKGLTARNVAPAAPRAAVPADGAVPRQEPAREAVVAKKKEQSPVAVREKVQVAREPYAPGTERMAGLLVGKGDAKELAPLVGVQEKSFGFTAKVDPGSVAFRFGVNLMDLQIALLAGDGDRAQAQATRLAPLLESLAGAPDAAPLERLAAKLEQGEAPASLAGSGGKLERLIPKEQVPYARLGVWAEGARLALKCGNRDYLAAGVPRYFGNQEADATIPPAAAAALKGLQQKLKRQSIDLQAVEQDVTVILASF